MAIRRKATEPDAAQDAAGTAQACAGLSRVLAKLAREDKAEVLDLGPFCGQTVTHIARRGARVQVEPFEPPPPVPKRQQGEAPPEIPPIRISQPDEKFHLVLAWEHIDFVPPERLKDFAAEIRRLLCNGGWLFLFSHMKSAEQSESPARYRLLSDERAAREPTHLPQRRRWTHSTRDIERSLKGFSIQGVHLHRNQMREFLAIRT